MDQFGVLVESIGFKSQSRSTPLSKLKAQPNPKPDHHRHHSTPPLATANSGIDLDAFFVGPSSFSNDDHDIFGFNSTNNLGSNSNDLLSGFDSDIFGGNTATDHFGQPSKPSYSDSSFVEDHFSIFDSAPSRVKESPSKNSSTIDELMDFARGSSQNNGSELGGKISKDDITKVQDKLNNLKYPGNSGSAASGGNIKVSLPGKKGRGQTNAAKNTFGNEDSFGAWFSSDDSHTNSTIGSKSDIKDDVLDSLFRGGNQSNVENNTKQPSRVTKKPPSNTNHVDDFLFFGDAAPSAVEFHEIAGEPEERRRARFNQHMRTKERMAKALSEKNERDLQAQHEQEERRRSAESMDGNIKRWAAGKEGNLRALLSSLQYVLWPGCGWQPVSLTDMITSVSVKKVYHKATLCVHPDKVQQKGATAQQKYIAEKVFDILKESWNKFNAEEMR